MIHQVKKSILFLFALVLPILLIGCNNNSTGPSIDSFSLSIKSPSSLPKTLADTLKITSAKLLIRDLKFEKEGTENEGKEVKIGPFVINLKLDNTTNTVAVANVPNGTYDEVSFKIHQVDGNEIPPDPEFKEGTNSNQRFSVIVKGTFNGTPFIYKSKKDAQQKLKLTKPLVIDGTKTINVTLVVDPFQWFNDNGTILDPNDATNVSKIDNLIKQNIKNVFEDDDKDGNSDD